MSGNNTEYMDFVKTTHYGEGDGIGGWNCKHSFQVFIVGVSVPTYTKEQLEELRKKEKETFEYKGKQYNTYEAAQYQRKIESNIRNLKREALCYKETGMEQDLKITNSKITMLRKEYKQFSEVAGISEKKYRLSI